MKIRTEPQFISPSDFMNYYGINLDEELKSNNNISNKANIFLRTIEDRVMAWVDANTFRNFKWEQLTDYQLEHFQKALLVQAMYVFRNSDIALDSGYDPDTGIITSKSDLNGIVMCSAALDELKLGGMYNLNVINRRSYVRFN